MYCELEHDDLFDINDICIYPEPYDSEITFGSVIQALEDSLEVVVHHFDDYVTYNSETFLPFETEDGTNYELSSLDLISLRHGHRIILFAL